MQAHEQAQFLRAVGIFIQQQITLATAPLLEKIQTLETELRTPIDIDALIERMPIKEGPPGKDGKDGEPINYDDINEAIWNYMEKQIQKIPIPKDGKDGIDGKDGRDGKDGADVVAAFRDSDRHLILTLSNGVVKDIGQIHGEPGKDGEPGLNGRDGFGFDDFGIEYDGEKTFTFYFVRGEDKKVFTFITPLIIYRGIWRQGKYLKGDAATYEGGMFVAKEDTETKPGTSGSNWQLATKRGDEGKKGEPGEPGAAGKDGRHGRDLTQMGFDGAKY